MRVSTSFFVPDQWLPVIVTLSAMLLLQQKKNPPDQNDDEKLTRCLLDLNTVSSDAPSPVWGRSVSSVLVKRFTIKSNSKPLFVYLIKNQKFLWKKKLRVFQISLYYESIVWKIGIRCRDMIYNSYEKKILLNNLCQCFWYKTHNYIGINTACRYS